MKWIASLLALTLCSALCSGASAPAAIAVQERIGTLSAHPRQVEVGEPIEWTLDVLHAGDSDPALEVLSASVRESLDVGWAWLDTDEVTRVAVPGEAALYRSRLRWRAVALEPGVQTFPLGPLGEAFDLGDDPVEVEVEGVLGALEDEPREARGFRDPKSVAESGQWILPAAIGGALFVVTLLFKRWRRARRSRVTPAGPPAVDELRVRLDQWAGEPPKSADTVRAAYYEASKLARGTVDERLGDPREGLTDDEWLRLRESDERIKPETRESLRKLLTTVEATKYGSVAPSPWAVQETLQHARAVQTENSAEAPVGEVR